MITAGIDVGLEYTKVVILKDGEVVGRACGESGGARRPDAVRDVYGEALKAAGVNAEDVEKAISTGKGKFDAAFADEQLAETITAAKAANVLADGATAVVGIGADETVIATLDGAKIKEFAINQKCAAALGLFLESMADRFDMTIEELGALEGESSIQVNDGCIVFAELDALSLVNRGADPKDVARAMIEACAWRANSTINDIYKPDTERVVLIGGMSKNAAFVRALEKISGIEFVIPDEAYFASAIGCAALAAE